MEIGSIIKKYRKEAGLTQEEMAERLGVTTPAVNKWENGNSRPDIELLAPIARLLHISLDTLLSFHEQLSDYEVAAIIERMDRMFSEEGYEKTFEWALGQIREYPNCNMLIWQIAVVLDARRMTDGCENEEQYEEQINAWYERALQDEREEVRHHAAESLFGFCLQKKDFARAEQYLNYISDHDPMKKIEQGRLYAEQGKISEAYEKYESTLFAEYNTCNLALSMMMLLAMQEENMGHARFLVEKMGELSRLFEMGAYNEHSSMLNIVSTEKNVEETYKVVKYLLENVETMYDFRKSGLYRHMKFKNLDTTVLAGKIKGQMLESFRDEEEFGYMKGYGPWIRLMHGKRKIGQISE